MQLKKIVYTTTMLFLISAAMFAIGQMETKVIKEYIKVVDTLVKERYYFDAADFLKLIPGDNTYTISMINVRQQQINQKLTEYIELINKLKKIDPEDNPQEFKKTADMLDEQFPGWQTKYRQSDRNVKFQAKMNIIQKMLKAQEWENAVSQYIELLNFTFEPEFKLLVSDFKGSGIKVDIKNELAGLLKKVAEKTGTHGILQDLKNKNRVNWDRFSTGLVNHELNKLELDIFDLINQLELLIQYIDQTGKDFNEHAIRLEQDARKILENIPQSNQFSSAEAWENELLKQLDKFHENDLPREYITYCFQIIAGRVDPNGQPEGILGAINVMLTGIQITARQKRDEFLNAVRDNIGKNNAEAVKNIMLSESAYNIALRLSPTEEKSESYEEDIIDLEKQINGMSPVPTETNLLNSIKIDGEKSFQDAQTSLKKAQFETAAANLDKARQNFKQYLQSKDNSDVKQRYITDIPALESNIINAQRFAQKYIKDYKSAEENFKSRNYQIALEQIDSAVDAFREYEKICPETGNLDSIKKQINSMKNNIDLKLKEQKSMQEKQMAAQQTAARIQSLKDKCREFLNAANNGFEKECYKEARIAADKAMNVHAECLALLKDFLVKMVLPETDINEITIELSKAIGKLDKKLINKANDLKQTGLEFYKSANVLLNAKKYTNAAIEIDKALSCFTQALKLNADADIKKQLAQAQATQEDIAKAIAREPGKDAQYYFKNAERNYADKNYPAARLDIDKAKNALPFYVSDKLRNKIAQLDKDIYTAEYANLLESVKSLYNQGAYEKALKILDAFRPVNQTGAKQIKDLKTSIAKTINFESTPVLEETDPADRKVLEKIEKIDKQINEYINLNINTGATNTEELDSALEILKTEADKHPYCKNILVRILNIKKLKGESEYTIEYIRIMQEAEKALAQYERQGEKAFPELEKAYKQLQYLFEYSGANDVRELIDDIKDKLKPDSLKEK